MRYPHATSTTATAHNQSYAYDATGNRKQRSTYGTVNGIEQQTAIQTLTTAADSNRMLQNDSWTMTLSDAAGNTLRQSQNLVYAYNGQGRLNEVRNPTNLYANYSYNALGQRTLKRVFSANNAVTATYSYLYGADGQLFGQKTYSSTGKPSKAQYWVWLDGQPIAGIELEYTGKGAVSKTSQYYLHSDHLNTPRMATNQNQALLWSWNSDAFGTGSVNEDAHGNKPSLDMPLRFPGQIYDAHTAMNYNYFRDYDPNTGRYIQSDPIGLKGGINTYNYVGGNPLSRTDPLGLDWIYQQSTGNLLYQPLAAQGGGTPQLISRGGLGQYAGQNEGLNNPAYQNVQGTGLDSNGGPLPQGTYVIGPQQLNVTNVGTRLPASMRLIPDPLNDMFGRKGFLIHGDNGDGDQSASEGCPIIPKNIRNRIGNSNDKILRVVR